MDLQMNKGAHFFGTYVGFKKREEHLITYKSEISRSQIDFFGKEFWYKSLQGDSMRKSCYTTVSWSLVFILIATNRKTD